MKSATDSRSGKAMDVGVSAYRRFCDLLGLTPIADPLPPARAAQLPSWMRPELVATDAAAAKLRAWSARTPQPWPVLMPADVLVRQAFVGCEPMAHITARVLSERLPPPVTDYLLTRVTFIGVGLHILGFCSAPIAFDDRPHVIVLSACEPLARFEALVAHECAHAWLEPEPSPGVVTSGAFWTKTVLHTTLDAVPDHAVPHVMELRRADQYSERVARGLTRVWGFEDL